MFKLDRERLVQDFKEVLSQNGITTAQAATVIEAPAGTIRRWGHAKQGLPSIQTCCLIAGNFGLDFMEYVVPDVEAATEDLDADARHPDEAIFDLNNEVEHLKRELQSAREVGQAEESFRRRLQGENERLTKDLADVKGLAERRINEFVAQRDAAATECGELKVAIAKLERQVEAYENHRSKQDQEYGELKFELEAAHAALKLEREKPLWKRLLGL